MQGAHGRARETIAADGEAGRREEKSALDFIVIGAQKSGTTSLFHYLKGHPEIALPRGKEAPFFSHDSAYLDRGWDTYMRNLCEHGEMTGASRRWGTVTPHYMYGSVYETKLGEQARARYDERTVPERIRAQLPGVKLIAILRDPVARAVSHHRMLAMRGEERRPFDAAIARLLDPQELERARRTPAELTGYVVWGEYGRILQGYLDVFGRDQLLVLFTEQLERDPARVLREIELFIGVSEGYEPPELGRRFMVGRAQRGFRWRSPSTWMTPSSPFSPQGVAGALRRSARARKLWHALPRSAQKRVRGPQQRLAARVAARNRDAAANETGANARPSPQALARLREHYAQDTRLLAQLIGAEPPWSEQPAAAQKSS